MDIKNSILLKYTSQWIVTDKKYSEVFLANEKLEELQKDIKRLKIENAVVMFVPPFDTTLSPTCL